MDRKPDAITEAGESLRCGHLVFKLNYFEFAQTLKFSDRFQSLMCFSYFGRDTFLSGHQSSRCPSRVARQSSRGVISRHYRRLGVVITKGNNKRFASSTLLFPQEVPSLLCVCLYVFVECVSFDGLEKFDCGTVGFIIN